MGSGILHLHIVSFSAAFPDFFLRILEEVSFARVLVVFTVSLDRKRLAVQIDDKVPGACLQLKEFI